jgi:hypothetical protein
MPPTSHGECAVIDLAERRRARQPRDVVPSPPGGNGDFWAAAAAVGWLLAFLLGLALFDGRVRAAEPAPEHPVYLD